jgi:hypothetical protein
MIVSITLANISSERNGERALSTGNAFQRFTAPDSAELVFKPESHALEMKKLFLARKCQEQGRMRQGTGHWRIPRL